jgi:hypothetical protein
MQANGVCFTNWDSLPKTEEEWAHQEKTGSLSFLLFVTSLKSYVPDSVLCLKVPDLILY